MIDLISNGLSLRKQQAQKTDSGNVNPQNIRNKSAKDKHHHYNKPAQSAYSAKVMNELNAPEIIDFSNSTADYAENAGNQSSTAYALADNLRNSCGFHDFDLDEMNKQKLLMPVQCEQCTHFTPDSIGSGAGIGQCAVNIKWTQEIHGKMPLYRYAERHCVKYNP